MNVIKSIQAAMPQGAVKIGTTEARALRIYANNKKRNPTAPIEKFFADLRETGPWPLEEKFLADSIPWLKDIVMRKDGEFRQTAQARRLNSNQSAIIRDLDTILFVGMTVLDFWKETKRCYAVYRAVDKSGDCFDFFFIPWQASEDPTRTGLFPCNVYTDML